MISGYYLKGHSNESSSHTFYSVLWQYISVCISICIDFKLHVKLSADASKFAGLL